jgi:hypothetical protein
VCLERQSPNVPKKQDKFTNFCKNTMKMTDTKEIDALWASVQQAQK